MNKSELIEAVATSADISKASAGRAVDAVFDTITESMKKSDPVVLIGFGTFGTKNRAARTGRNPQTGEEIEIKAATLPSFKPGKALKDAVNN
ncbi:MAG: HU family DNA-binding protein [Gammaproteobacteria bacterium]|nr:HU family DNA-binding protein [Gammaproteobacteria bacterium]MCY4355986.1 HU family DNA-binding protein [Gammaproteobacteria bacterium]